MMFPVRLHYITARDIDGPADRRHDSGVMRNLPSEIGRLGPRDKGAYVLEFRIDEPLELSVGALGAFRLESGWYYYVGSALGGLKGRLKRHVLGVGKRRWHIDYLAQALPPTRLWYVISQGKLEARTVKLISKRCSPAIPWFGCGDRPRDGTHLFFSRQRCNFLVSFRAFGPARQVNIA